MCVCAGGLLFLLQQPNSQFTPKFSCMAIVQVFIPRFLQLHHSLLSVSAFLTPCGHGFLSSSVLLSPPYPSSHSYCLSGSHGPPTKAVGVGQWNNSWHPYGLHFPDHSVVPVLLFVSSCVMEQEKEQRQGKANRVGERNGNGYEKLWSGKAVRRAPFLFFLLFFNHKIASLNAHSRFLPSGPAAILQL